MKLLSPNNAQLIALVFISALLFLFRIDNTHLWDQDEGYYATVAAEMFARSDWITPTFNGVLFAHKPPMMYWGMMCGFELFGVNEFGARFVSGLFGVGTIVITYLLGKCMFGARAGFYAAMAIASCLMFVMVSRSATADAHLTFWVALSLFLWFRAYERGSGLASRKERLNQMRWREWAYFYLALGCAVLTKGPIGFLFPMAIIGLYLLTELHRDLFLNQECGHRWLRALWAYSPVPFFQTVWQMRPWTALAVMGVVAGPWYAMVQQNTGGAFLKEFIGVHHLGRFSHAMDNHSGPIYYYVLACLIGMFPWSSFAIPIALTWNANRQNSSNSAFRFVSCWIGVYMVIFSLANTKLPNYVLPAYPALAIVSGLYFAQWDKLSSFSAVAWRHAGWAVFVGIGLLLGVGMPILGFMLPNFSGLVEPWQPQHVEVLNRLAWVGLPMVVLGLCGWWMVRNANGNLPLSHVNPSKSLHWSAACFSGASVSIIAVLAFWIAPKIDRFQASPRMAESWARFLDSSSSQVHAIGLFRPSMVFYFRRPVQFSDSLETAFDDVASQSGSLIVTTDTCFQQVKEILPKDMRVLDRMSQLPGQDAVLVLGHESLKR